MKRTITVTIILDEADQRRLLENSVERVINTSIKLGSAMERHPRLGEDASTNWQDWEELKPLVDKLWAETRNAVFLARNVK